MGPLSNANTRYFKNDVPFWNEIMQHGTYDDFWKARNLRPHLKNIKPAVMTVGGWFDAENLFGALETYKNVEAHSPGATNILVMGPWRHGGWSRDDGATLGPLAFSSKTSRVLSRADRVPVLPVLPERQGLAQFSGGLGVRNRHQSSGRSTTRGLRETSSPARSICRGRGGFRFEPPAESSGATRVRRIYQRPCASGRVHRSDRNPNDGAIT